MKPQYKILVVDDDPDLSKTFALMLEHEGHEVQTVDGGLAALAMLERRPFDVILTDHLMPGLKGDQLASLVKQRWPNLPLILTSGSVCHTIEADSPLNGVDCLLNKPFTLAELREAFVWVIDRYAEHPQGVPLPAGLIGPALPASRPATGSAEARQE
jgi:CheY-like chemotaxis protein